MPELHVVDQTPRKMPTKMAIKRHWESFLLEIDKFDSSEELWEEDYCFACGFKMRGGTERAHIVTRMYGGSDEVSNLVLLCGHCHKDSEFLYDIIRDPVKIVEVYKKFITQRTIWDVYARVAGIYKFVLDNNLINFNQEGI